MDIETDEAVRALQMADCIVLWADYHEELKAHYDELIKRQEEKLRKHYSWQHVEVDLVVVLSSLCLEAAQACDR